MIEQQNPSWVCLMLISWIYAVFKTGKSGWGSALLSERLLFRRWQYQEIGGRGADDSERASVGLRFRSYENIRLDNQWTTMAHINETSRGNHAILSIPGLL